MPRLNEKYQLEVNRLKAKRDESQKDLDDIVNRFRCVIDSRYGSNALVTRVLDNSKFEISVGNHICEFEKEGAEKLVEKLTLYIKEVCNDDT